MSNRAPAWFAALTAVGFLLSACGSTSNSVATTDTGDALEQSPSPADDELLVSCKGPSWPISAYQNARPLSDAGLPDLEGELANFDGVITPSFTNAEPGSSGAMNAWLVLGQTSEEVTLLHLDGESVTFITFTSNDGNYRFQGSSSGPCDLEVAIPDDMSIVDWELDPAWAVPTPDSTDVHVLITERACASSTPPGDRLLPPQLIETNDSVRLSFLATPLSGAQTCAGNPPTPITVQLASPLGARTLVDARELSITVAELVAVP